MNGLNTCHVCRPASAASLRESDLVSGTIRMYQVEFFFFFLSWLVAARPTSDNYTSPHKRHPRPSDIDRRHLVWVLRQSLAYTVPYTLDQIPLESESLSDNVPFQSCEFRCGSMALSGASYYVHGCIAGVVGARTRTIFVEYRMQHIIYIYIYQFILYPGFELRQSRF